MSTGAFSLDGKKSASIVHIHHEERKVAKNTTENFV